MLGKYTTEVKQYATFFYSPDNREVVAAESGGKLQCTETFATDRQQRVGKVAQGAAPPPITDLPSITSTEIVLASADLVCNSLGAYSDFFLG